MKTPSKKKLIREGCTLSQVGVLPYRLNSGKIQCLILTSRETRRFVIPKGWPIKSKTNSQAAAIEAEEEAGVTGSVHPVPIGAYQYWKRMKKAFVRVQVVVYALEVRIENSDWKEQKMRQKQWLALEHAASLVDEPELASLISGFKIPSESSQQ